MQFSVHESSSNISDPAGRWWGSGVGPLGFGATVMVQPFCFVSQVLFGT